MGGRHCCVKNCRRRSHDHLGRKIPNGLTFHCFPAWRTHEGEQIAALTGRRREAWVAAVRRSNITFDHIPKSLRVCSRHFHSGKPAYEMLESDPDWVPSLHMGHSDEKTRRTERLSSSKTTEEQRWQTEARQADVFNAETQRESEAAEGGTEVFTGSVKTSVLPWSEIKSVLQLALQGKINISEKPEDETHDRPGNNTDISFRDFFRNSLEASLEASSWSRAQKPASASCDFHLDLNFKVPPVREKIQTCEQSPSTPSSSSSSSSSCLNCVRLNRRIKELEEKLFHLTVEQEDTKTLSEYSMTSVPSDQVLQSPEPVHTAEDHSGWVEPLPPPQVLLREGVQDVDLADESPSSSLTALSSSKRRIRRPPRFNHAWLKMFWFLRYSAKLDEMWCHVCRIYAHKSHQNVSLIKGSRIFKLYSIKKHSGRIYHKENVKRYRNLVESNDGVQSISSNASNESLVSDLVSQPRNHLEVESWQRERNPPSR